MTGDAGREHRQRLLEAVLSGERSAADAEVQSAMAADERFAREVVELQALQATLTTRAAEVRDDLAHAAPELEALVASAVRARGAAPARPARRWWPWLAAAVLLLALVLAWPRGRAPDVPQHLGGTFRVEAIDGGLRFHETLKAGAVFVVRVFAEDGAPLQPPLEVATSTWRPEPAMLAAWPRVVRVEVNVVGGDLAETPRGELGQWQVR